ncbi:uncharacterized protein TrAtP1_008422 [Trichoderma atroviride]|uniref:Protein kinase domain-containing protein n=1 Tax=Hypocrea atroviridis (strain ATCC 20476 / IMI 206040) TaxID=452589 RepID=G9NZS2_HYPAI|nr:uncharacterized protein TRIATDRAFT_319302 [Trichoderma atroviride IMI 206040]EHK43971.1 hypothetical protein TRIATDRAFT_319302 [Trichoderma atroviride IMI 206040]UKZ67260.1 hypothetical protein TrAtP1_008422 [Trichoderma atroviride]
MSSAMRVVFRTDDISESEPERLAEMITAARIATPYVEGASLQLEIMRNYQDLPLPQVTSASIVKILGVTMSSVMRIILRLDSGEPLEAVLKLFDRRFGEDLRSNGRVHWPYMRASEKGFNSMVRRNDMDRFITKLLQDREKAMLEKRPWHFLSDDDGDDDDGGEHAIDRFEAAVWQECEDMFECEVKAYEHLKGFQGTGIPRLLATVRLAGASSIVPSDLINEPAAKYWHVKGILLQYIPGINLMNLDSSSIDVKEWEPLVQRSVDLAHEINKSGLVMDDCSPRNVIVHQQSQQPFFIDFAQSWLKHEMRISWETSSSSGGEEEEKKEEEDDFILDDEYWDRAGTTDNPGAIGAVMTTRLKREKGVEIKIQYPDTIKLMVRPQDYYPDYQP